MKRNIICLLLITLLGLTVSASLAQQNQNVLITDTDVEKLNKRITELEGKLKVVENVEKMELAAKLTEAHAKHAEAHAKLIETEFDKLKLELKDYNQQWLRNWIFIILGILSVVGFALWKWLTTKMDGLIESEVNKRLTGFEEAVEKVNILEDQMRILRKEQAASKIEATFQPDFGSGLGFPRENEARREEVLKEILEEALSDVYRDKKYHLGVKHKAAEILAQKSPPIVDPLFGILNSAIDPDSYIISEIGQRSLLDSIAILSGIVNFEVYDSLTEYLNRLLLLENIELRDIFLTWTVFSLTYIGIALNTDSSISIMKKAIPYLDVRRDVTQNIEDLARYFDKFEEHEGIKDILNNFGTTKSEVKETCLDLLEKYDPEFVREQREEKAATNTEGEETDESEPKE